MPEGLTLTAWLFGSAWAGTAVLAIYLHASRQAARNALDDAGRMVDELDSERRELSESLYSTRDAKQVLRVSRERLQNRAAELRRENEALRDEIRCCRLQLESAGVERSAVVLPSGERLPAEVET